MILKLLTSDRKTEKVFTCVRYTMYEVDADGFRKRLNEDPTLDNYYMFGNIDKANYMKAIELYDTQRPSNPVTYIYIAPGWGDQIYIMNDNGKTLESI